MRLSGWGALLAGGMISGIAAFFILIFSVAAAGSVVISEIMWDGTEYLELHNTTGAEVNLGGWTLTRQQAGGEVKTIVTIPADTVLAANGYWLIEKTETATETPADLLVASLTLVNTGEEVKLLDAGGSTVDVANQLGEWFAGSNTTYGVAMERTSTAAGTAAVNWHTSTGQLHGRAGTPRAANSTPPVNAVPIAVISSVTEATVGQTITLSAEDSTDADGDPLSYAWAFPDNTTSTGIEVTRAFTTAGAQVVRLAVSDGEAEHEVTRTLTVTQPIYSEALIINEYLPNPAGSDTSSEFIELKNTGNVAVDLAGWQLDDADGGSTAYTIGAGTSIGAGSVRAFMRSETKLALNNDKDSVRLLDPSGTVKFTASYVGSSEGHSYNRTSGTTFVVSTTTTPGQVNVITAPTEEDEEEDDDTDTSTASSSTGRVAGTSVATVPLADIREEELGTTIRTEGVVSAPPGVLGKQLLYLAGSGAQVYFSKAEWPDVKLGDRIALTGRLSSNRGEARLKVAQAADITKVTSGTPPTPHRVETGDIGEDWEGSLVIIQGQVTETNGDTFYVDDGSGEVRVVIGESTKIDKPKMKQGTDVTITGVVSETTSGFRLLPRFQEDVRLGLVAGLSSFPATGSVTIIITPLLIVMATLLTARRAREPLCRWPRPPR